MHGVCGNLPDGSPVDFHKPKSEETFHEKKSKPNLWDSQVYRVKVSNGKAELLSVPEDTYAVSISRNGKKMMYSLTRGLGYGSETWIANTNGKNAELILSEPSHIIAFAQWSPNEKQISYILMPDSNIPFTVGELWLMDSDGQNRVFLSEVDSGHGYAQAWSPNGKEIAFVVRENPEDIIADQNPWELASNIYLVDVEARTVSQITQFEDALTEQPAWSSDGELLAFSSGAGGSMDIWVYDKLEKKLHQTTQGKNALYPAWLPEQ